MVCICSSKASNAEPEPFYNAHRDRSDLFETQITFDNGWYAANRIPEIARWMGRRATIQLQTDSVSKVKLDLTTHAGLQEKPLRLEFLVNGVVLSAFSLLDYGWLEVEIYVPESIQHKVDLEIRADRIWQPVYSDPKSSDDRELSIAVCNIEVYR